MFNINNNELSYGRGYVYSLQYHLVWCTKYRKKVLKVVLMQNARKCSMIPDPGNGGYAGSYPSACRLQTTVLYLGYDQDHEGEHCQADVSCESGTEEGTFGRASVESILLCSNGE